MRVVVSGGGTGGHISPVLAVISELNKQDSQTEILYIGSESGLEANIIPKTGIDYRPISCGKFRRYHKSKLLNIIDLTTLFKNGRDFWRFIKGYFQAKKIIKEFDPDVVFTKGGFVSLPVGLAATSLKYPLVIHESDSTFGLSNKMLAKKAEAVCVSYPLPVYKKFGYANLIYTGNPIREDLKKSNKELARKEFNLVADKPVILVIGGSQGAYIINQLISEVLEELLGRYQLIHISGERDYDWLDYKREKLDQKYRENYHLYNFLSSNLKDAYNIADLVISRAGNNVIAELAAMSKPTILIPITNSANDHQFSNAKIISRMGGALLMIQEHTDGKKLLRQIELLIADPEEMAKMGQKLHQLALFDAAQKVAQIVFKAGREMARKNEREEKIV